MASAPERLCKRPSEVRKFTMNFSKQLDTSETISSIDNVDSEPIGGGTTDLAIGSTTLDSTATKVDMIIQSGTAGQSYRVYAQVTTSAGQKLEGDGILLVRNK